jgi:hypothetical protein
MLCTNNTHVEKNCSISIFGLRHCWLKNLEDPAADHLALGPFGFPCLQAKAEVVSIF